jgi:hypothetical protein
LSNAVSESSLSAGSGGVADVVAAALRMSDLASAYASVGKPALGGRSRSRSDGQPCG